MRTQRLLVTAVASSLQHAEQAGVTHRFDVESWQLAGLLGLGHALAQLWYERGRAGDKVFMAELFRSKIWMSAYFTCLSRNGHDASLLITFAH